MPKGAKRTQKLSRAAIRAILSSQKQARLLKRQEQRARAAVKSFRVTKADKGNLVFIGVKGQRNPQYKGRKGYLVHVTKTGKKRLVKQSKQALPFLPRKITDITVPFKKQFRQAQRQFSLSRLQKTASGKTIVRGSGKVATAGAWDFSDKTVAKIAKSLKKTIESQRSHRSFLVQAMVRVKRADGTETVYEVNVPIDKADHVAIRLAGLENFVRQKFYAYMARELAYDGLVSSGSANHVARLKDNQGLDKADWTQDDGQKWRGNESEVVHIVEIQWQILQAK